MAAGIDLGGSKIELQRFGPDWQCLSSQRIPTPDTYPALLDALCALIEDARAGQDLPVGIGTPGVVQPGQGRLFAGNIAASGHPVAADLRARAGGALAVLNDAQALTLSEAVFGAGKGAARVAGLVLGTGVGGGFARGGTLDPGHSGAGGEFGHIPVPAALLQELRLPVLPCACGARGCFEPYVSGAGVTRLGEALLGRAVSAEGLAGPPKALSPVWEAWTALVAALARILTLTLDPQVIVLGGGLSRLPGCCEAIADKLSGAQFPGLPVPLLVPAEGGDASGARGAAFAAWQEAQR